MKLTDILRKSKEGIGGLAIYSGMMLNSYNHEVANSHNYKGENIMWYIIIGLGICGLIYGTRKSLKQAEKSVYENIRKQKRTSLTITRYDLNKK